MVYLALKKVPPKGFFQKIFWWLTKWRLLTQFPHAGIVIKGNYFGNELLHTTVFRGVHSLSKNEYCDDDWVFVHVDISDSLVKDRYFSVIGAKYDWFSLLAFAIPFRFTKASWFYCYELSWFLLKGEIPTFRVTPEMLLKLVLQINNKNDDKLNGDSK